jgi:hypothetical protein
VSLYFDRRASVLVSDGDVGGVSFRWSDLRIKFQVEYERRGPATAQISCVNLSPASRKWLQTSGQFVQLNAGYQHMAGVLFRGDIRRVYVEHGEVDIETKIEAGDGEKALVESTMAVTLGPNRTTVDLLREITNTLGLTVGYADLPATPRVLLGGQTLAGGVKQYLDDLAAEFDADWWIADGQLQIVARNGALPGTLQRVSPETGLIGSPSELTKQRNNRTRVVGVKWTQLLRSDMRPGQLVQLESREFTGLYVIRKIRAVGDSGWDSAYHTNVEATERVI